MVEAVSRPRTTDSLPRVRGTLRENVPLAKLMWFRVGGPAEILFEPADSEDLAQFLAALPSDTPVSAIGVGSNLLVRDGGIPGVVVRLGRPFSAVSCTGAQVRAGAAAMDVTVARAGRDAGIAGLEFLSGIPGTIGGALRMNAGAYGRDIGDVAVSARALDRAGRTHDFGPAELGFTYRGCAVPEGWIFTGTVLQGEPGSAPEIAARMADIADTRSRDQPVRERTGGSTFKNPPDANAWALIDAAGCRGLTRGGAQVSPLHCNFLINTGGATAADLENLGEEVRDRVEAATGVRLEWEIRRVGTAREPRNG
ncbi:MAG: UDP-N-acetylmuramate dehydrogenase [Defluviicoccus sp.]|nr:UDP-N-acetylmuramate dehydrogenase [Defluviicoccus sp.]MDE0385393.1 UDP-N-acetylmuramate dehydrogenase [Defluviicoccus sp.]